MSRSSEQQLKGFLAKFDPGVRHLVLDAVSDLDAPAVRALMAQALKAAKVPLTAKRGGTLIIKSISAVQRARRSREKT